MILLGGFSALHDVNQGYSIGCIQLASWQESFTQKSHALCLSCSFPVASLGLLTGWWSQVS